MGLRNIMWFVRTVGGGSGLGSHPVITLVLVVFSLQVLLPELISEREYCKCLRRQ